jgi:hypothetical protein
MATTGVVFFSPLLAGADVGDEVDDDVDEEAVVVGGARVMVITAVGSSLSVPSR